MFLDCITKPCSVVVSRISGADMRMPVAVQQTKQQWVIRHFDSPQKVIKIVRSRRVSPMTLYTQIDNGLVTDVCCKRFKKRHSRNKKKKTEIIEESRRILQESTTKEEEEEGSVRDLLDRVLHQVTLSTMDDVEMARLVRTFCREHGFDDSEFEDPVSLLRPSNVVDGDVDGYYVGATKTKRRRYNKRQPKTVRKVTPKAGIIYISDGDEPNDSLQHSEKADEKLAIRCDQTPGCDEVVMMEEPMDVNGEALPVKKRLYDMMMHRKSIADDQVSAALLKESILRTLLLDPADQEPPKSPMPIISDVVSLKTDDDRKKSDPRDSPEIVEIIKVHHPPPLPERRKTTAYNDVVHNLRLEIAALERLAAEKEREKRFLLYFKNCKEELLKRLTSEPSSPPPNKCPSGIFSSVKRLSESSSFRPYSEPTRSNNTNSYKSLTLTTAGQWSTTKEQPGGFRRSAPDILHNKWTPIPPHSLPSKDQQWIAVPANLPVAQQQIPGQNRDAFGCSLRGHASNIGRDPIPQCVVCKIVKAAFLCSGCGKEWYCSQQCQRQNWKNHSRMCTS